MENVAECLISLDRGAEGVPIIDECLRLAAGKAVHPRLIPSVMDLRLRYFEKTKDVAGCRQTAELWEKQKRTDPGSLYDGACMWAVTAAVLRANDKSTKGTKDTTTDGDRAMERLKQAVAAGYKDVTHMRQDKDLDALRERMDFQKLLAGLEAGKEKDKN
jgi:hypothetical protein